MKKFPLLWRREHAKRGASLKQTVSHQSVMQNKRDVDEPARPQPTISRDERTGEDRRKDPDHISDFDRSYGANITNKDENHVRIMTCNIKHFPLERVSADRYDMLKHELQVNQYDIVGLTETNYNWSRLSDTDQIYYQTQGWWRNKSIQNSWLRTDSYDERQFGGTSTIVTNDLTTYITEKGADERDLGRWSWYTLSDPGSIINTTIITMYYPQNSQGAGSVNGQQLKKI